MKPTCIYIFLPYEFYQYDKIVQIAMLQDSGRSRVIAYHSREIGKMLLLLLYTWKIYMNDNQRLGGMVLQIWTWVWHSSEARIAFVPPVSVKDRPLHWVLGRSPTYYLEHILVYGSRKGSLFSCHGLRLFSGLTNWRRGWWRSKHHTESGTQE